MMSDWLAAFGAPYGGGKRGCRGLSVVEHGVGRDVGARDDTGHERLDADQGLGQSEGLKAQDDIPDPERPIVHQLRSTYEAA